MGVELMADEGPRSILWSDTFHPYGVEVFPNPIGDHLRRGPDRPEGWPAGEHPQWSARRGPPVKSSSSFWEHIEIGPGYLSDGTMATPAQAVDVPVAVRLDFDAGPVWFVAGQPDYPNVERTFVPGDEIMVVFTADKMRQIGFPDGTFIRPE